MSEHLTTRNVELYTQRQLPAAELLAADAHLSSCQSCRQLLREKENTEAAVSDLRTSFHFEETAEPEHPSYAQFTAYAENRLDEVDREIFDSHLYICAKCADVMQDLRAFVATPESLPAAAEKKIAGAVGWRERFLAFWHSRMDWMSWQMAGATAALLLLVGISAIVWLSLQNQSRTTEVARVAPTPIVAESPQAMPTVATVPTPAIAIDANANGNTNGQEQASQGQQSPPSTNSTTTPARSTAVALKDGGGLVTVDGRGNVNGLDALTAADRQAVSQALTTQRVETPSALASLTGSVAMLRGGSVEGVSFPIVGPVGTVVATERPTLRWGKLEGATTYEVSVFDRNFRKVAASQPQTGTEWVVTTPLPRGDVYTWQVKAIKNGEAVTSPEAPAPEAKFMVLDATKAEELERARERYAGSHLTLGTLYARAGLLDEAEREFELLLRDNPKSPVARKLLQSVRALRNSK